MKFSNILLIILLFCLNIVFNNTNAQTSRIDSLEQVIDNNKISNTDRINTLDLIAKDLFRIDKQQAYNYLQEALNRADSIKYTDGLIETKRLLGVYYYYSSNYDSAYIFINEALRYYSKNNNLDKKTKCLVNIGNVYLVTKALDSALYFYKEALIISQEINNKQGIATALGNMGLVYKYKEQFPKALKYYKESLKAHQEVGNISAAASIINKIGIIYIRLGRLDDALDYNKQALKMSREINDKLGEAFYLNNLGVIYSKFNKIDSALYFYNQSLELKIKLNNKNKVSTMYINIGEIYSQKGDQKKALEHYLKAYDIAKDLHNSYNISKILNAIGLAYFYLNDYTNSKKYTLESIELAERIGSLQIQANNRHLLSDIYYKSNNYKKALSNYKLYSSLTENIRNKQNSNKIAKLELEYEYKEKNKILELDQEKKRAILSKEIEDQRKSKNTFIFLLLVATLALLLFVRLLIIRKKTNKLLNIKNREIKKQALELEKNSNELTQQKLLLEETVKERTSELIMEKEKVEESNSLKSAILNNISHEFRTPMNGIIGFSSLIIKPNITEEEKKSYSKIISSSCNQLLNIVTDTVDISKINSNQCKVIITKASIQKIVDSVIASLKEKIDEKGLIIETKIEIEKDEQIISTDKNKLERILWHLLSNSIKFSEKGKISITVSIIDEFIHFKIIDNGKGIPKDMQENIFKPFIQINNSQSENVEGNGFGLPITKAYIELLGGEIKIDSEIEVGTIICFTIPYKKAIISITKLNKTIKKETPHKTILLAEDDEINAYLIERIFSKYNINLITAINGKEAVDIFKQKHSVIDMVLLDLRMPIMNGFEAISIIRKINSEIPVIAYTAYCSKSEIAEIIKSGFDNYVSKPIDKEKLLKIVFAED